MGRLLAHVVGLHGCIHVAASNGVPSPAHCMCDAWQLSAGGVRGERGNQAFDGPGEFVMELETPETLVEALILCSKKLQTLCCWALPPLPSSCVCCSFPALIYFILHHTCKILAIVPLHARDSCEEVNTSQRGHAAWQVVAFGAGPGAAPHAGAGSVANRVARCAASVTGGQESLQQR